MTDDVKSADSNYPAHPIDTPFPVRDGDVEAPGMSQEELDADAAADADNCTHSQEPRDPRYEENLGFHILRLANGEWVMGQGAIVEDQDGGQHFLYFKLFTFNMSVQQDGRVGLNVKPWPTARGTIELDQVAATAFPQDPENIMNLEEAYLKLISNVQVATERQAHQAARRQAQANRILTPGR